MKRPDVCKDAECECLWHDRTNTFCSGKTPERVDVIDGEEHTNDYQFCIITGHRGWEKHRFNKYDFSLAAKATFAGLADCFESMNLERENLLHHPLRKLQIRAG